MTFVFEVILKYNGAVIIYDFSYGVYSITLKNSSSWFIMDNTEPLQFYRNVSHCCFKNIFSINVDFFIKIKILKSLKMALKIYKLQNLAHLIVFAHKVQSRCFVFLSMFFHIPVCFSFRHQEQLLRCVLKVSLLCQIFLVILSIKCLY